MYSECTTVPVGGSGRGGGNYTDSRLPELALVAGDPGNNQLMPFESLDFP